MLRQDGLDRYVEAEMHHPTYISRLRTVERHMYSSLISNIDTSAIYVAISKSQCQRCLVGLYIPYTCVRERKM